MLLSVKTAQTCILVSD